MAPPPPPAADRRSPIILEEPNLIFHSSHRPEQSQAQERGQRLLQPQRRVL